MNVYEIITTRITDLLKQGTVPWQKQWTSNQQFPLNLVSKKHYRGINTFILHVSGFESPYWLTFNQVKDLKGTVKKGEKSSPVIFWNWVESKENLGEKIPFLRYYNVFNVSQTEGLEKHIPAPIKKESFNHSPIAAAQQVIENMTKAPQINFGMDKAFIPLLQIPLACQIKKNFQKLKIIIL